MGIRSTASPTPSLILNHELRPTWFNRFSCPLLYCTTMALFGYRRIQTKKTKYIKYQVYTLVFIQVFFLFLLPNHLYGSLVSALGEDSWFIQNVLPEKKRKIFSIFSNQYLAESERWNRLCMTSDANSSSSCPRISERFIKQGRTMLNN